MNITTKLAQVSLLIGAVGAALAGCGESTDNSSPGDAGSPGGSAGSGASAGTAAGGVDSGSGGAGTGGTGAGAASSGGTGVGGYSGACGECDSSEFCDSLYDYCSDSPLEAGQMCRPRPQGCDDDYRPVCGCNGKVYSNECEANTAGSDIGADSCDASVTPQGYFPTGPYYCDPTTSYGKIRLGDVGDRWFECVELPNACAALPTPDCSCLTFNSHSTCQTVQGAGVEGLVVEEVLL